MGIDRWGPPEELISSLASQFNITNFVETGTYQGNTASWASKHFSQVFTIEYSQALYDRVKDKYGSNPDINFIWGDSRTELDKLIDQLKGSSLFWLDAHWSGGLTYGKADQCPLIEEIKILNRLREDKFIFIDDARFFTSAAQRPCQIEQWPEIASVIDALREDNPEIYISIIEDVIIAVPSFAKSLVAEYCRKVKRIDERAREKASQGMFKFYFKQVVATLKRKVKSLAN